MIRHVSLTNWKAFDQLDLDLPEGTSFIVARNGVGKTSLLQALHFGLFGDRRLLASSSTVERAVRGGRENTARIELKVNLGGVDWVVARLVPGDLGPNDSLPSAVVSSDGARASEDGWTEALTRAAGVGLTELRLLAAIGEGGTLAVSSKRGADNYNLVRHLSDVLGVSRLQETAKALRRASNDSAKAADNERLALRDRPQRSSREERVQLAAEREPLPDQLRHMQGQLGEIERRQKVRSDWSAWRNRERAAQESALSAATKLNAALTQHTDLLDELVGRRLGAEDLTSGASAAFLVEAVRGMQSEARLLLDDLRGERDRRVREIGGLEARLASIDGALALLSEATAICPTCRQPLSEGSAQRARGEHLKDREQLSVAEASTKAVAARADSAIAELTAAINVALPSASSPPAEPVPDGASEQDEEAANALLRERDEVRTRLQNIDASLRRLEEDDTQRAADAALSRRLASQYRKADLALVTADTFDSLAESMCRDRINPLAEMLAKRWAELWPGRPSLSLDLNSGEMFGTVAKTKLSIDDLSGGERAVAIVLLRLLALQSASKCPILLMDEPLEHLDPRNRRLLASLLVAATRASEAPPRQILVTTYEESVTRRLHQQVAGSGSNVVYIATRTESDQ